MDKLKRYRAHIKTVIEWHSHPNAYGEVEMQHIFDEQRDHYQLLYTGWVNGRRQYGSLIHCDLKDDKIWIQHDGTEVGVAHELVELGVPPNDIVLAYHPLYRRPYTGFGTG